jgi:hypothetical protein
LVENTCWYIKTSLHCQAIKLVTKQCNNLQFAILQMRNNFSVWWVFNYLRFKISLGSKITADLPNNCSLAPCSKNEVMEHIWRHVFKLVGIFDHVISLSVAVFFNSGINLFNQGDEFVQKVWAFFSLVITLTTSITKW